MAGHTRSFTIVDEPCDADSPLTSGLLEMIMRENYLNLKDWIDDDYKDHDINGINLVR